MHELGIMTGVMEAVEASAKSAGALRVLKVNLSVGVMTEATHDALQFSFEVLKEGTASEAAELHITTIEPKSECLECGAVYGHDRFHIGCPHCKALTTRLVAGKELQIDSIEVDLPDEGEGGALDRLSGKEGSPDESDLPKEVPTEAAVLNEEAL